MPSGRLESAIVVPTGGWPIDMQDVTGAFTATIPAGTYVISGESPAVSPTALPGIVDAWSNAIVTAGKAGWSLGVSAAFRLSLTRAGGTCTVTWDAASADAKSLFGFTANVTTSGQTGANQMQSVWLADCPVQSLNLKLFTNSNVDDFRGWMESDYVSSVHPSGLVYAYAHSTAYVRSFTWPYVSAARTWRLRETLVNESFETFQLDCLLGRMSWAVPGGPVTWYYDDTYSSSAPDPTNAISRYKVIVDGTFAPPQSSDQYAGLYSITLPRCIIEPDMFGVVSG